MSGLTGAIDSTIDSTVDECIRVQCGYCANGVPVLQYPNDENLYHHDVSPCNARRIRRRFQRYGAVAQNVY